MTDQDYGIMERDNNVEINGRVKGQMVSQIWVRWH